jgi:hypothetical protein
MTLPRLKKTAMVAPGEATYCPLPRLFFVAMVQVSS